MHTLWFKRKTYGWGWVPASWQGWLIIGIYLLLIIVFSSIASTANSMRVLFFGSMLPIGILTGMLIRIAYLKGERPRWQWGNKK